MAFWTALVLAVALEVGSQLQKADAVPAAAKANKDKASDEKLRRELLDRMQTDQEARKRMLALMQKRNKADGDDIKKNDQAAEKRVQEIDRENTDRMKQIVHQFGWPGKSVVGADGAKAAWILVQHADHDRAFQKQCLKLLQEAAKKGEATGEQLAYLTDRVRLGEKRKQVYGTQCRVVDGKLQPYPIDDESNVDTRRKEVGLSSLADYLKFSQWVLDHAG